MRGVRVFVLLALLATVFGQYQPNCQPVDVFYMFDSNSLGTQQDFYYYLTERLTGGYNTRVGVSYPNNLALTASFDNVINGVYGIGASPASPGVNAFQNTVELLREQSTADARHVIVYFYSNPPNDGFNNVLAQARLLKENTSFPIELYVVDGLQDENDFFYPQDLSSGPGYYFPFDDVFFTSHLVARAINHMNVSYCNALGSNIVTFDGVSFPFNGLGDFWFYRSTDLKVQVRLGSCDDNAPTSHTCLRGLAVSAADRPNNHIEIHFDPVANHLTVVDDGNVVEPAYDFGNGDLYGYIFNLYLPETDKTYHIVGMEYYFGNDDYYYLNVTFGANLGLAITLNVPEFSFGRSYGLCGRFDGCAANDFYSANQAYISTSASASEIYSGFANTWRVASADSLFEYANDQVYYYPDYPEYVNGWAPGANLVAVSESAAANCQFFVDKSKFYYDVCVNEFTNNFERGVVARNLASYFIGVTCYTYCTQGYLDNPTVSQEYCEATCPIPTDLDLHKRDYNETTIPHMLRQLQWSNTFQAPLGGTYTLVLNSSFCHDPQINVTVDIVCDASPSVNAGADRVIRANQYVYNNIILHGVATDSNTDKLQYSWKVVDTPSVDNSTLQLFSYTGIQTEFDPETLKINPYALSDFSNMNSPILVWNLYVVLPGNYTFELAVFDGCSIARDNVTIEIVCDDCDFTVTSTPLEDIVFNYNRPFDLDTAYTDSSNSFSVQDAVFSVFFQRNIIVGNTNGYLMSESIMGNQVEYTFYTQLNDVLRNSTTDVETVETVVSDVTNVNIPSPLKNDEYTRFEAQKFYDEVVVEREIVTTTTEDFTEIEDQHVHCIIESQTATGNFEVVAEDDEWSANRILESDNILGCPGDYTVDQYVWSFCDLEKDTINLHVGCNLPPVAHLITCNKVVDFQYNGIGGGFWPTVDLDARDSRDPEEDNTDLYFRYEVLSKPVDASNPQYINAGGCGAQIGDSVYRNCPQVSFTPTYPGVYGLSVTVGDGCSANSESTQITARCEALNAVVIEVLAADSTRTTADFNQAQLQSTSQGDNQFTRTWQIVSTPAGGVANPSGNTPLGDDITYTLNRGGSYTVQLTTFDGCHYVSVNRTFIYTCAAAPAITINEPATATGTVNFNYLTGTFDPQDLEATVAYTPNPERTGSVQWNLVSQPVDGTQTFSSNLENPIGDFTPAMEGTYIFNFWADDLCSFVERNITVNAVCQFTLGNPTITATGTTNNVYTWDGTGGQTIDFTAVAAVQNAAEQTNVIYSWYITSPDGTTVGPITPPINNDEYTITVTSTGQYNITVIATDGCRDSVNSLVITVNCQYSASINILPVTVTYSKNKFNRVTVVPTYSGNAIDPNNLPIDTFDIYEWQITNAPVDSVFYPQLKSNTSELISNNTISFGKVQIDDNLWRRTNITTLTYEITYYKENTVLVYDNTGDKFAGCFSPDLPGVYTLRYTVLDGYCGVPYTQTATVTANCNASPTVNTETDKTIDVVGYPVNSRVFVQGTATDTDGDSMEYFWSWVSVPADSQIETNTTDDIFNANSLKAAFNADVSGRYELRLIASDGCSNGTDTVVVNVNCNNNFAVDVTSHTYEFNGYTPVALKEFTLLAAPKCNKELEWYLVDFEPTETIIPAPPAPQPEPSSASQIAASLMMVFALLAMLF